MWRRNSRPTRRFPTTPTPRPIPPSPWSWPQATDNKTAQNNLTYKVFYAASAIESLDGLTGVAAPGKTSLTLSGLEGSTDYYVAVAAYDAAGNYVLLAGGPFRTQDPPPKNLAEYEVYDYFDAIQAKLDALPSAQPRTRTSRRWRALPPGGCSCRRTVFGAT